MASPDPATPSQKTNEELQAHAKTIAEATVEATRQLTIMWEAKLKMAIASNNQAAISEALDETKARRGQMVIATPR